MYFFVFEYISAPLGFIIIDEVESALQNNPINLFSGRILKFCWLFQEILIRVQ